MIAVPRIDDSLNGVVNRTHLPMSHVVDSDRMLKQYIRIAKIDNGKMDLSIKFKAMHFTDSATMTKNFEPVTN